MTGNAEWGAVTRRPWRDRADVRELRGNVAGDTTAMDQDGARSTGLVRTSQGTDKSEPVTGTETGGFFGGHDCHGIRGDIAQATAGV